MSAAAVLVVLLLCAFAAGWITGERTERRERLERERRIAAWRREAGR